MGKYFIVIILIAFGVLTSCENIFSPSLDESGSTNIISDQMTIDGVFTNFKYAYTFKDTSCLFGSSDPMIFFLLTGL